MLFAIFVTLIILVGLGYAQSTGRGDEISSHPYNNRASDASAARRDHLG